MSLTPMLRLPISTEMDAYITSLCFYQTLHDKLPHTQSKPWRLTGLNYIFSSNSSAEKRHWHSAYFSKWGTLCYRMHSYSNPVVATVFIMAASSRPIIHCPTDIVRSLIWVMYHYCYCYCYYYYHHRHHYCYHSYCHFIIIIINIIMLLSFLLSLFYYR